MEKTNFDKERFKEYRIKRRLSIPELSEKSGVDRTGIWRYEVGSRKPKLESIMKMAKVLKIDWKKLLK